MPGHIATVATSATMNRETRIAMGTPQVARRICTIMLLCATALLAWPWCLVRADETGPATGQTAVTASGYSEKGADTCLRCHNGDRMQDIFRTAHGQGENPEAPFAYLQCESCHGPGGDHTSRRYVGAGHTPVIDYGRDAETPLESRMRYA